MARSDAALSILQFDAAAITHVAVTPAGAGFQIGDSAAESVEGPLTADALRAFAETHHVAAEALYTVLPRHDVTVRILTLPARDPAEIASMVELTAGEYVPYPRESLVIKHHRIAELPGGESRVLLVLAHQDTIDRHLDLLRAAALEPRQIYLSTVCLHAAAAVALDAPAGRFALVHLGPASLEVAVIDEGALQFSRGVAHDGRWDLASPHGRESLAYEVRDALSAYRRECEDGLGVDTLYVGAEHRDESDIAELLAEATEKSCTPARFLDAPAVLEGTETGRPSLVAVGAALAATGRAPLAITLLPESLVREHAMRDVQQRARHAAILAAVVLAALGAWFAQAVVQRMLLIDELQTRIDTLAPRAEGVAAKQERLQIISRQVNGDAGFLPLLSAVSEAAPPSDFNITRVQYGRGEGLDIWGRSRTKDLILSEFLGNLRGLGEGGLAMLARAHSQYETAGRERDETVFNYHVTVPARGEEDRDAPEAMAR